MKYTDFDSSGFDYINDREKIKARKLELINRNDLTAFVFSEKDGFYTCLLPTMTPNADLPRINGLSIQTETFRIEGNAFTPYIVLECKTAPYLENFTRIIKEVLEDYDSSDTDIHKSLARIISKWRHFLSEPKYNLMSEENIIGLIGELLFLKKLTSNNVENSVNYWTADRGEEDFTNNNVIIEVKTTLKEKHEHIINGIDQLKIVDGHQKYILSILLFPKADERDLNLPDVINDVSQDLMHQPKTFDDFFKKLKSRGYDQRDADLVYNYSYYRGGFFKVDNSFPKLTTNDLNLPLNPRISKVRYMIDMEGLHNLNFISTDPKSLLNGTL
jgi:hypothetical protein